MKKDNNSQTLKRLIKIIFSGNKARFLIVIISILISAFTGVLFASFLQIFVDDYVVPLLISSNPDFTNVDRLIVYMAAISLMGVIASLVYSKVTVTITEKVIKKIRDDMFTHMQKLPLRYFDTNSHGDIMSHYTSDTDTLNQMIAQSIPQLFSSTVTIVFVFVAMVRTSLILTGVVLVMVVIMVSVTKYLGGQSSKYFKKQQKSVGTLNGYVEEMITGQKIIKVFNHEPEAIEQFEVLNKQLRHHAEKAHVFGNIFMPVMMNIGNLQYIILAIVGGILVYNGNHGLTSGAIISFLQLSKNFSNPVTQVSQQINSIAMALAGATRIFNLMDEAIEVDDGQTTLVNIVKDGDVIKEADHKTGLWAWKKPVNQGYEYIEFKGEVHLIDVDFSYTPGKKVLKNISVYARKGEKVALVGATGAGKTTITNLLNRFYDIDKGLITFDGIDVKTIKKASLRRALGIVLQDTSLFTGTVMENIRYGNLEATDDEVIAAAKTANAHGFISRLPQGYQTVLSGNGDNLSQGQKQLIAIARAAVANPPIMILDEATSSIDTRTEYLVQSGMDRLMKGRTVFVIAHRLSTIKNSDVIMVMENGEIIERGNHDKLISEKGKYYGLYMGNFELE